MREVTLVGGGVALVDDEDYDWVVSFNPWRALGTKVSKTQYAIHNFWCRFTHGNRGFSMHRLIMNPTDDFEIDHINRNGLDNRKENLRLVSHSQNLYRSTRRDNKHGFRGVRMWDGKYKARVVVKGKEYAAGTYLTAEEAARARDRLALKLHGEFTYTNFPKEEYADPFVDIYRRSVTLDGVGENL